MPTGGSSSGSGTGSWWGSGAGSSGGTASGSGSGSSSNSGSGSSSSSGSSSGGTWGGSGNDYVCPGEDGYDDEDDQTPEPECDDEDDSWDDDEECDTQAAKEVVNSVTVAAESVYPSTTAASLTTSWISTQTAQSVTQIENIGGKVSASGLLLFLGCC